MIQPPLSDPTAEAIWQVLSRASVDRRHPWRTVGFSTQSSHGPQARNVILRRVAPSLQCLYFFSDSRSGKIRDLAESPQVALLFWDAKHLCQLRVTGVCSIDTTSPLVEECWQSVPPHARLDYGTTEAPGSVLVGAKASDFDLSTARAHFCVLTVQAHYLDHLTLGKPNHRRVAYQWNKESAQWLGGALVP